MKIAAAIPESINQTQNQSIKQNVQFSVTKLGE